MISIDVDKIASKVFNSSQRCGHYCPKSHLHILQNHGSSWITSLTTSQHQLKAFGFHRDCNAHRGPPRAYLVQESIYEILYLSFFAIVFASVLLYSDDIIQDSSDHRGRTREPLVQGSTYEWWRSGLRVEHMDRRSVVKPYKSVNLILLYPVELFGNVAVAFICDLLRGTMDVDN